MLVITDGDSNGGDGDDEDCDVRRIIVGMMVAVVMMVKMMSK